MKKYEIDYVEIKDKKMVRDMSNKAILSTDINALRAHRDKRRTMQNVNTIMDEINSKGSEPNGRINGDTILLRVIK